MKATMKASITLLLFMSVLLSVPGASGAASLSLSVPSGSPGSQVTGTVGFSNPTGVLSFNLVLDFSSGTALSFSGFTRNATFFPSSLIGATECNFIHTGTPGKVRIVGLYPKTATSAVSIGNVTFKVSSTAGAATTQVVRLSGEVYTNQGTVVQLTSVSTTFSIVNVDTDKDGMPDTWEIAHGLNPKVNDAALDPDGDGFTNLQEYRAGTDPKNAASRPRRKMPWLPLLLEE